jgi:hypothetical protein
MSTKFEQLLDYLVNENHEKANELFHEIVVEKSREIYENLIAEEETDDDVEESFELEDAYSTEGGDNTGDETDDFGGEISVDGDNFDDSDSEHEEEPEHEKAEDTAILDIKHAIQELESAFAELEAAQGSEKSEMGWEDDGEDDGEEGPEFDDDEETEDEMMGMPAMEGRRMTREYVEKVGHNYGGNTQKQQGDYAGAGTGENQSRPVEGKSPVSSGSGKPTTGATSENIAQGGDEGQKNTGTTPNKVNKGITPEKSEQFTGKDWETNSAPGGKAGVKNLTKQGAGYPGNNKTPGPVGSGTGDKAGQTSVSSDKPFLKKL